MEANKKVIDELNDLLTKNYDAEKGYALAAEEVKDTALSDFFRVYSKQRYEFGHDIKALITALGGKPDKGTSVAGDLHRGWINVRSLISGHDEDAIIQECIRGEKTAVEEYQEALDTLDLSDDARTVIKSQHSKIKEAVDKIQELHQIAQH